MYDKPFVQQGWQCPICLKVYAPSTPMCWSCPPKTSTWTDGTGKAPDIPPVGSVCDDCTDICYTSQGGPPGCDGGEKLE